MASAILISLTPLAGGCGDALTGGDYQGTAILTLRGNVTGTTDYEDVDHPFVRVAMFFNPGGVQAADPNAAVEQPGTSQSAESPFSFTLNLFDPPGDSDFYRAPDGTSYAIGQVLAYPDLNGDGRRDGTEPVIGTSVVRAILYTREPLSAQSSPTGLLLPAGYSLVSTPIACTDRPTPPEPPPGSSCPVQMGKECMSDAQCSPGVCAHYFVAPWPHGGCVLPDPPPPGCPPPGAVPVTGLTQDISGSMSSPPPTPTTYWVAGCNTTADCGRTDLEYQCDMSVRACLPTALINIMLSNMPDTPRWCP